MSLHFREKSFAGAHLLPLFVLVDPLAAHVAQAGLNCGSTAGVLAQCRAALRHARARKWKVAFVCNKLRRARRTSRLWIREMEPQPSDGMFERRAESCYSSPYFADAADVAGELVVAGFFRGGGCFATAADCLVAGHRIAFLCDAIQTNESEQHGLTSGIALARMQGRGRIRVATSAAWRSETDGSHCELQSGAGMGRTTRLSVDGNE